MNLAILTTNQIEDDLRLIDCAEARGYHARTLDLRFVSIVLSPGKPAIYYRNEDVTQAFDAVIPRLNVSYTDYGINVLQQFICAGTYASESPEALRLGRDKLKCLQYVMEKNLPFPNTGIAYTSKNFVPLLRQFQPPIVIKLIESTEGTGVFLANTEKEAENIIKTFGMLGASFLVQQFIEEARGVDLRAFVVGDRIVAAMKRESQDGDFRANISLGGHSCPAQLSEEEEKLVLDATRSIGINIAGVDFVRSKQGPMLLEINVSPDFTGEFGIEKVTGCDVADAIIAFTAQQVDARCNQQFDPSRETQQQNVDMVLCAAG